MSSEEQRYQAALETLLKALNAWRAAHPNAAPKIQFNFPPQVALVATINDAIDQHWISVDYWGRRLINFLCAHFPQEQEPTVLMVRCVVEYAFR